MKKYNRQILGWIAVSVTVVVSGIWAYWGTIENFHEGWYSPNFFENIGMFLFQYLLVTIVLVTLALISLTWKLAGLLLHIALAGFSIWFFNGAHFTVLWLMIVIPILLLGVLYYFGMPQPKWVAGSLIIGVPLMMVIAITIPQGIKVSKRLNDGNEGMRIVVGNGVTLAWAPRGLGWPEGATTWHQAMERVQYLSEDGLTLMDEIQNIWRLPSIDEAVRSMMLHGENAGGIYDQETQVATYVLTPDKETPLWAVHSQVIYYWTANEDEDNPLRAYIIVYHGGVFTRQKTDGQNYLGFRAVKNVN